MTLTRKWKTTFLAWGLLLPTFCFLTVFTFYPIVNSVWSSLFKDDLGVSKPIFLGLGNYIALFRDPVFLRSFWNNLLIGLVTIPISIVIAVLIAVFANAIPRGEGFFRVGFFYPVILPMVAVANIWLFIYTPAYGLLGQFLKGSNILGNPKTAIWGIMLMLIWKQSGYLMIFYLSGLQNISRELYESARLDGAGPIRSFLSITWPLLKPTTIYVIILSLTNAYKIVDHLYIMTKGGPNNASNMLLFYIYQTGFDFWDVGYSSTLTVVLVSLLLLLTCIQFFSQDKKTYYS
jgi:sn-glycerol 3-phosphate transport system permease protein